MTSPSTVRLGMSGGWKKAAVAAAASLAAVYVLQKAIKWWRFREQLKTYSGPELQFPFGLVSTRTPPPPKLSRVGVLSSMLDR